MCVMMFVKINFNSAKDVQIVSSLCTVNECNSHIKTSFQHSEP